MWGMQLSISSQHTREIINWAAQSEPQECCGLLIGVGNSVEQVVLTNNVAANSEVAFEIDPATLILWEKRGRLGGGRIIGYFHSHPNGAPLPSQTDADLALPDGRYWLIVADNALTAWQAVEDGVVYKRFLPIELNISG